ncbi:hypothetical protein ACFCW4_20740 [Streptomyces virginiae]
MRGRPHADSTVYQGGVFRHTVRFKRLRLDVTVEEALLSEGSPSAATG